MAIDTSVCTAGTSIRVISSNMFQFMANLSQVDLFIGTSQGLRPAPEAGGRRTRPAGQAGGATNSKGTLKTLFRSILKMGQISQKYDLSAGGGNPCRWVLEVT